MYFNYVTKKIYRDKVIAIAGFPIDADYRLEYYGDSGYWSNRDIVEIVNTTKWKLSTGFIPVVKCGHWDNEQALKGEVKAVRTGFIEVPTLTQGKVKRMCLKADFEVFEPYCDMIDKGKFPNVSVETMAGGVTNMGEPLGEFLRGFALLGKDMSAIQDMSRLFSVGGTNFYGKKGQKKMGLLKNLFGKRAEEKKKYDAEEMVAFAEELKVIAETIVEPPEAKDAILEIAMKIETYMADMMDEQKPAVTEDESTKTDDDEPKDEDEMKSATRAEIAMKKQLSALIKQNEEIKSALKASVEEKEAEKQALFKEQVMVAFVGLVEKGLLLKQDEKRFANGCTTNGIEKETAFWDSAGKVRSTPADKKPMKQWEGDGSNPDEIPKEFRTEHFERYLEMNKGKKDANERAEAHLKAAYKSTLLVHSMEPTLGRR